MEDWVLRMPWSDVNASQSELLLTREWLVTNGLGGYASGTISGAATRRYHALLIAALPSPLGRRIMLNHLSELIRLPNGKTVLIGGEEHAGGRLDLHGIDYLKEFRLEQGLPVWQYTISGVVLEKRVLLLHMQNTVYINYRLVSGPGPVRLKLRPSVHFRPHEAPVSDTEALGPYRVTAEVDKFEVSTDRNMPALRMHQYGESSAFTLETKRFEFLYRMEQSRGYEPAGQLWSPGYFRVSLDEGADATLVASTENWSTILALHPDEAFEAERRRRNRLIEAAAPQVRQGPASELVLAADQFIIKPAGRVEDAARAAAAGDEVRSVIAGYHWFTDWGRDTMISLEGLTLTTGRHVEAGYILRTFSHYVRDGLIPNMFPEGERDGLYHTADASLWFFHALDRYLRVTKDESTLRFILPKLKEIAEYHLKGTRFCIGVDSKDGLLRQGAEGYQLTWMDAKVGDWVVTPRRGKAVEINALWYNALCLLEGWLQNLGDVAGSRFYGEQARQVRESFNARFWYEGGGHLYDVIDGDRGDDPACRPNQVFAISLPNPVLDESRWGRVLEVVLERLVTPLGLRSLAPGHPDYKPIYYGDLRARDAAYHQGTVWGWLIGPFIDAWLKVHPRNREEARQFLEGFVAHLSEACIGSISEIFDAEAPYVPRGCIAQAWSVAEVLRCWALVGERNGPD